jgi:hypothetical protein
MIQMNFLFRYLKSIISSNQNHCHILYNLLRLNITTPGCWKVLLLEYCAHVDIVFCMHRVLIFRGVYILYR